MAKNDLYVRHLSRSKMYPEREIKKDSRVAEPDCYCCRDTGYIDSYLIYYVIPEYDCLNDKIPVCHYCNKHESFAKSSFTIYPCLDLRIDFDTCRRLHEFAKAEYTRQMIERDEKLKQKMLDQFDNGSDNGSNCSTNVSDPCSAVDDVAGLVDSFVSGF